MMNGRAAMITVRQKGDGDPLAFAVEVDGARFDVTLAHGDLHRLGAGRPGTEMVTAAFRFLLDREPLEAILRRFDFSVIARYFPEFEAELPRYLDRTDRTGVQPCSAR
jgi:hypothetical protein